MRRCAPAATTAAIPLVLVLVLAQASPARAQIPPPAAPPPAGAPAAPPPEIAPSRRPTSGGGHLDRSGINEHAFRGFFEGLVAGTFLGYALTSSSSSGGTLAVRMVTGGLIGAGLGVALPLWLNVGKEVRSGDVVWINAAQNWGFVNGFSIPLLFQLTSYSFSGDTDDFEQITSDDLRLDFGLSAIVSLAAGGLASYTAPLLDFTPGQAAMIGTTSLWGGLGGMLLMLALRPDNAGSGWDQAALAGLIVGSTGGALTAWTMRDFFDVDRGRSVMVDFGAVVGLGTGLLVGWFLDPDFENQHAIFGSLLAGMTAGTYFGWVVSKGMDDFKQSAPREVTAALFNYQDGKWASGIPTPRPLLVQGASPRTRVAAGLSLLEGRF